MGVVQSPFAVARFMLDRAAEEGVADVTPMKVLKLAYIAHGWVLCFTDSPLLSEPVQAWQYGPVIPSVYHYFKEFGAKTVPQSTTIALPQISSDDKVKDVLLGVWKSYRSFSGLQLSAMTHQPGTPWHEAWNELGGKHMRCVTIDNMKIRDHYRKLAGR
jgi:uncharacterized phage-associated protein